MTHDIPQPIPGAAFLLSEEEAQRFRAYLSLMASHLEEGQGHGECFIALLAELRKYGGELERAGNFVADQILAALLNHSGLAAHIDLSQVFGPFPFGGPL